MQSLRPPEPCTSIADFRAQIDAIDVEPVRVPAIRSRYFDRAGALEKAQRLRARTTDRVREAGQDCRRSLGPWLAPGYCSARIGRI